MSRRLILFFAAVVLLLGGVTSSLAGPFNIAQLTNVGQADETGRGGGVAQAASATGQGTDATGGASVEATGAQQETENSGVSGAVRNLTLEEAFQLALENNIDLKKARIDYDRAIVEAEQADYNADAIDADDVSSLQDAQTKYVSKKQKDLAEDAAEQAYEIAKEQTKNNAEKAYYDVLKAARLVTIREASVKRAQQQLEFVNKKFKAGTAIKTEVYRGQASVASAKADLANTLRDLKSTQIELNKIIGIEINANVKPVQVLKYEKATLPTEKELLEEALKNRLDLKRAKNSEEIAKANYDLTVSYSAPNTFNARRSKTDFEKAKLDTIQMEQNVIADVISTLSQVQRADEVVQLQAINLDQARENQRLAQRRYEIGVGSSLDALAASIDFADAEAKYVEAVYNYAIVKNQLQAVVLI